MGERVECVYAPLIIYALFAPPNPNVQAHSAHVYECVHYSLFFSDQQMSLLLAPTTITVEIDNRPGQRVEPHFTASYLVKHSHDLNTA